MDVRKRCPNRLSLEHMDYNNSICLNILNIIHKRLSFILQKTESVITLAAICRLPVQYNVEKQSNLLTHKKHYIIRTYSQTFYHKYTNVNFIPYFIHDNENIYLHIFLQFLAGIRWGGGGIGDPSSWRKYIILCNVRVHVFTKYEQIKENFDV
jgi:hypothetical protein